MNTKADSSQHRLLVVSRLIPISCQLNNEAGNNKTWEFNNRRSYNAMYSGINSLKTERNISQIIYFGLPGEVTVKGEPLASNNNNKKIDDYISTKKVINNIEWDQFTPELKQSLTETLYKEKSIVPIFVDPETCHLHYEGYCKTELWPLFHYILWESTTQIHEEKNWEGYVRFNQIFANVISKYYQPGDLIWIQDYHLLILPGMLRKSLPTADIGIFIHTTFPTSEIFRCLPKRKEVLKGILGSNLVGFQIYSYSRHFISSCTRVLGLESTPTGMEYNGRTVSVEIFTIGIDVERIEKRRIKSSVLEKMETLKNMYEGKRIIIGTDKLDRIKGVKHKLYAYEYFLNLYPEWQNKVVLIQVTSPSNSNDSKLIETQISELVAHINGQFGTLEYTPVHYYHQDLDQDEYFALLNIADVGLITSVRDGMNTTSHEFVLCQKENHGPLILSEFTGTAGSLSGAILVNPWDHEGVAQAIQEALLMTKEERNDRYKQLYKNVSSNTSQFWAKSFYKELREKAITVLEPEESMPILNPETVINSYINSERRCFFFDYDGTLTPICNTPSAAVPGPEMLKALTVLSNDPRNYIFIISGRDQEFLDLHLGHLPNVGLSAEHGSFIKYPGQPWKNAIEDMDLSWKDDVMNIFNFYTERTQGSFIEQKKCAITWHYRLADPNYGNFQSKECQTHLENVVLPKYPVEVLVGKKCLEVRPSAINKGSIVNSLLADQENCDFVLCAGDDKTDEDMFKALVSSGEDGTKHNIFTCRIGPPNVKTLASCTLASPADLIDLMGKLAAVSQFN